MTRIVYEPGLPAMRFSGHAGAGTKGNDLVCAAVSALMFTLLAALEGSETKRCMADGFCAVSGGERTAYEVVAAGLRERAAACPEHIKLEVRA